MLAPVKRRTRNSRTSSIGEEVRSSQATNAARATAAAPNPPRTRPSVQPRSAASMIDQVSTPSPAVESTAPSGSSRDFSGSRDSGTSAGAAASAATTMGMLTRNTAVQSKCSISQPPATGPTAIPSPATAAQMPIALGRSSAGKTFVRMDSVEGMMSAPPTPIRARLAIRASALGANAESSDPAPNTERPATSALRRPKRSPRLPIVSSSPANTSV